MSDYLIHSPTPPIEAQRPTSDGLRDVIEGLPIIREPNPIQSEHCNRCERKNQIRRSYDLPQRDPTFSDGERVVLMCSFDPNADAYGGWNITTAFHRDHALKGVEHVGPELACAKVTAQLEQEGWTYKHPSLEQSEKLEEYRVEDASVVRDSEIEWFSDIGEGQEREPVVELDEDGRAHPKPTDPIPDWPQEPNIWRWEIQQELGDF